MTFFTLSPAKPGMHSRFPLFPFLKFRIPNFAFPNQIPPSRPLRTLREPISSANPKFKIKNPRVSVSTPYSCRGRERGEKFNIQNRRVAPLTPDSLHPLTPRRRPAAFTLVELLAVVGIMGLLAAVAVPALKGLTGSGGRKQALSQLMGALEIARNTAISTGTNAAVIFPDRNFASQPYRYRSMAVISWDATNTNSVTTNSMLGSWITLPQGIVLHDTQINQLPTLINKTALLIPPNTSTTNVSNLRAIVFQSDGGLEERYYTNTLTTDGIAFYEGAVVSSFTTTTNTSKQTNNAETITLTHYTGRTITTLAKPK